MKIIELVSENFKRLNAHVVMDGKSVTVEGKNGVGKSSFIDAVWIALTGKEIPAEPIRQGKDSAKISLTVKADDDSQFIVERKFTQSGGTLTVKTAEGAKFASPQKFLDEKIGKISFDPFEFVGMQPRDQKKFLMELLGIDLTAIDQKKKQLLSERDTLSKSYNNLMQEVSVLPPFEPGLQEKSTAEAIHKFNQINATREEIARKRKRCKYLIDLIAEYENTIAEAKAELSKLADENLELPEVIDLQSEISAINAHNQKVKYHERINQTHESLREAQYLLNLKSDEIKQIEQQRIDLISKAKMPIDGLSFSDDGLLFEGLPFTAEQLSTAKLIEAGINISIALNPALRIMRIKDGSLLDSETLSIIKKAAKDNDYQLFIERVSDSKEIGFIIEE